MPRYDHPDIPGGLQGTERPAGCGTERSSAGGVHGHVHVRFWGEGHSWPYEGHPFPDDVVAEKTWMQMFEAQLELERRRRW